MDSFHVLLSGGRAIDALVYVHGYDIDLDDAERAAETERCVRAVAAAVGLDAIFVRSNLRRHQAFASAQWPIAHGGALAAVGHLLTRNIGRLLLSASYPYDYDAPWGSHWRLDWLWSSERVEVSHVGAELWRADKIREIARDPLAQRYLRVCWEHLDGASGNCSRCEKCVRTMVTLAAEGCLADFTGFRLDEPLAARVGALPAIDDHLLVVYERLLADEMPSDLASAVRALIDRSRAPTQAGQSA